MTISGLTKIGHGNQSFCLNQMVLKLKKILSMFFQPYPYQVTFHLPLHRYFSLFLSNAMRNQGMGLDELLPPADKLKMLMMHPLQIQVGTPLFLLAVSQ